MSRCPEDAHTCHFLVRHLPWTGCRLLLSQDRLRLAPHRYRLISPPNKEREAEAPQEQMHKLHVTVWRHLPTIFAIFPFDAIVVSLIGRGQYRNKTIAHAPII